MFIVDTCGWIEWLEGSPLAIHFDAPLLDLSQLVVPTAVQLEVYKWTCRERDVDHAMEIIHYSSGATVAPLTQTIALSAADQIMTNNLSFADAVIYATALHHKATLLTSDAHFKDLPNVHYIKKAKA